jgi:hypothetical protein
MRSESDVRPLLLLISALDQRSVLVDSSVAV